MELQGLYQHDPLLVVFFRVWFKLFRNILTLPHFEQYLGHFIDLIKLNTGYSYIIWGCSYFVWIKREINCRTLFILNKSQRGIDCLFRVTHSKKLGTFNLDNIIPIKFIFQPVILEQDVLGMTSFR